MNTSGNWGGGPREHIGMHPYLTKVNPQMLILTTASRNGWTSTWNQQPTCVKPYSMTCKALASRLLKTKVLMKHMPGSPTEKRMLPTVELKMVYFQLTRRDWRTKIEATDNSITAPDY